MSENVAAGVMAATVTTVVAGQLLECAAHTCQAPKSHRMWLAWVMALFPVVILIMGATCSVDVIIEAALLYIGMLMTWGLWFIVETAQ